jgi:hypothetical protein
MIENSRNKKQWKIVICKKHRELHCKECPKDIDSLEAIDVIEK